MGRVIIIQSPGTGPHGLLSPLLEAASVPVSMVRTPGPLPDRQRLADSAGVIVSGAVMPQNQANLRDETRAEIAVMSDALNAGKPVLGIGRGCQLLALLLGSRINASETPELGWHRVALTRTALEDPLFSGTVRCFEAFHWHRGWFELPHGGDLLAVSSHTPCQAFRYGSLAYGFLFRVDATRALLEDLFSTPPEPRMQLDSTMIDKIRDDNTRFLPHSSRILIPVLRRWVDRVRRPEMRSTTLTDQTIVDDVPRMRAAGAGQ